MKKLTLLLLISASFVAARIDAVTLYNNDFPTNQMASATRPESGSQFEIESADDFLLPTDAHITGATFTGLVPQGFNLSNIGRVVVEIYRVFPNDSNVGRTSGPPTFNTPNVPTRVNSPSDVAFVTRASDRHLNFTPSILNASFTANNSVQPGGIHPMPNQTTGGDHAFTGQEVRFDINFITASNPLDLPRGHYFFVPQVELTGTDGFPVAVRNQTARATEHGVCSRSSVLDSRWRHRRGVLVERKAPGYRFDCFAPRWCVASDRVA